jgi:hypothetical protein
MEQKVNVWKANLTNGFILGMIGIVYTLVMYFLDLTFNQIQGWVFLLIEIAALYMLVKSYRDNSLYGIISFGQALGAGVVICLYYSIISAVFMYILYAVIDVDLAQKQLAFVEEQMLTRGLAQEQVDAAMSIQAKILKPAILAPVSIFGNMIGGVIISLIVAAIVQKAGNPLIDTNSGEQL